jgi:hypothetical protein
MSFDRSQHDELHDLLLAMEEGSISAEGIDRIDELVRGNVELLRQYLEYVRLVSDLRFGLSGERTQTVLSRVFGLNDELDRPTAKNSPWATQAESCPLPFPTIVIQDTRGLSPGYSPFGGFLVSYLIAAVVVGVGILAGWAYRVSDHQNVAADASRSTPAIARQADEVVFVGRVVSLVDCRWADSKTEAFPGARIPLGRKYATTEPKSSSKGHVPIKWNRGAAVTFRAAA